VFLSAVRPPVFIRIGIVGVHFVELQYKASPYRAWIASFSAWYTSTTGIDHPVFPFNEKLAA
jgi:hypothetical protein